MSERAAAGALRVVVLLRRLRARPDGAAAEQALGPCEQAALACAVALAEQHGAAVTALACGPAQREDRVLAMALRAGCRRAVRVHDDLLDGLDYLGVARVLAAAVQHLGFDLVLCGDRSGDEMQGAIGPAVAEVLGVPHLSGVLDLRAEPPMVLLSRRAEGGVQALKVAFPLVAGLARFPRTASAAGDAVDTPTAPPTSAAAAPASIEELDLDDLGLQARELTHRARFTGRAQPLRGARRAMMLPDAAALVAQLRADHLLE